jgi:hypothetical protein
MGKKGAAARKEIRQSVYANVWCAAPLILPSPPADSYSAAMLNASAGGSLPDRGKIALQLSLGKVEFRNIRVRAAH